eukprot:1004931-Pyramimonas_sp.AAC.1
MPGRPVPAQPETGVKANGGQSGRRSVQAPAGARGALIRIWVQGPAGVCRILQGLTNTQV